MDDLRKNPMMAHLLDALEGGQDIGHYGRLVFAIVGRHFVSEEELIDELSKDRDFPETEARSLVQQVQEHDYSPPGRARILEYMQKQDFPILPDAHDAEGANVYRDLEFPQKVYDHIQEYHQQHD